jgi:integrative and conjugative element protein (TIGR02256 family)
MLTFAAHDADLETGGILLGWRQDSGLCVKHVLEVPDRGALHNSYVRRRQRAQELMNEILDALPKLTQVGYVGEWHVHPAPAGPSGSDRREIRRLSKKSSGPLGLIICARASGENIWKPRGLLAFAGKETPAEVQIEGAHFSE